MSVPRAPLQWSLFVAMEENIRDIPRFADVLCNLGLGPEELSPSTCYFLGSMLSKMGKELEQQFDAVIADVQAAKAEGARCV